MKKIWIILMMTSMLQLFTACENWLEVNPKSQVKNDVLFKEAAGFKTALFGIYTSMAQSSLYGSELTMSFMDVLAQYYKVPNQSNNYYWASTYDYSSSVIKAKADLFWLYMYRAIMNCNNLLENMEGKEELFTFNDYKLIRGETLGLRAYLHFDLLRLFAPSFAVGKSEAAIPYVDQVTHNPFPQLTNEEVVEKILADCVRALQDLKDADPLGPLGEAVGRKDDFLENRKERMNYWAVKALMARIYLWSGNLDKAKEVSNELIVTKGFGTSGPIFSLYTDKLEKYSNNFFSSNSQKQNKLLLSQEKREKIYEKSIYESYDNRLNNWTELEPGAIEGNYDYNTGTYLVTKYTKGVIKSVNIPLIRMNEMFYINAECQASEAVALQRLNLVRMDYGIIPNLNLRLGACVFGDELFKEYQKSFLAEGQLFYFMKRRDFKAIPGVEFVEDPRTVYCLPMPEDELEFGNLLEVEE